MDRIDISIILLVVLWVFALYALFGNQQITGEDHRLLNPGGTAFSFVRTAILLIFVVGFILLIAPTISATKKYAGKSTLEAMKAFAAATLGISASLSALFIVLVSDYNKVFMGSNLDGPVTPGGESFIVGPPPLVVLAMVFGIICGWLAILIRSLNRIKAEKRMRKPKK